MKITDQIYSCQLPGQVFGIWQLQCHLRIFQSYSGIQSVMITDMGTEKRCIPYVVEVLIEQIVEEFHLDVARLVWIEHYTPAFRKASCADFNQITFEWQNGQATNPRWIVATEEIVRAFIGEDLQQSLSLPYTKSGVHRRDRLIRGIRSIYRILSTVVIAKILKFFELNN